jgi:hypothetical protein
MTTYAVQWPGWALDTGTVHGGARSIKWAGGAGYYVMTVPVMASTSTTISCYVRHATGYTGTKPTMIIREPGQSDRSTTDTGAADTWNQLSDTWTTQSTTTAVQVIIKCDNTAANDYAVWVDDIAVF